MKKLLLGLVASANLLAALPTSAQAASVTINGAAPAQCGITGASSATITGGGAGGSLADTNGFLDSSAQSRIIAALNTTNTEAWCTGRSTVVLTRSPLVRGATGAVDASGFANAIGYDVAINIANATRVDGYTDAGLVGLEGSSDGLGGPAFNAFGPRGNGSGVLFLNDTYGDSFNATPKTLNLTGSPTATPPTSGLIPQVLSTPTRLAAGTYTSTVTLTITPTS